MLPVLSAEQIMSVDQATMKKEPISSIDLMERASRAFCNKFKELFDNGRPVSIYCGKGNNGGDGLAVGRLLYGLGYETTIYLVNTDQDPSENYSINLERLKNIQRPIKTVESLNDMIQPSSNTVLIDAMFGYGINRALGWMAQWAAEKINGWENEVVALDIPSGMFSDKIEQEATIVAADYTISFQLPKLAFFAPENEQYVGEWHLVDIQLDQESIISEKTKNYLLEKSDFRAKLINRKKQSHKGNYGHVLISAGSFGKIGASILAGKGALKAGSGLVSLHVPDRAVVAVQAAMPEAMVIPDKRKATISEVPHNYLEWNSIGVGPGWTLEESVKKGFRELLDNYNKPLVIDADALNILSEHKDWLEFVPYHSILTPHPGEFRRLAGESKDYFEMVNKAKDMAKSLQIHIILKGGTSAICHPNGEVHYSDSGNPGMATAGSGDLLTGILVSLLGQGYEPGFAADLGVYLHGLAGTLALEKGSQESLTALDIADYIGKAYTFLRGS